MAASWLPRGLVTWRRRRASAAGHLDPRRPCLSTRAAPASRPAPPQLLLRLTPNLSEGLKTEEREAICYAEMAELVEVQQKVVATMTALFVELDLEDSRRV